SRQFALTFAVCVSLTTPLLAQWIKYPTAGVPRTAGGKPNLEAPAPRMQDGKPDFSGVWGTDDFVPCAQRLNARYKDCGLELPISSLALTAAAYTPGGLPYRPGKAAVLKKRIAESSKDDPHAQCLPAPFLRRTAYHTCKSSYTFLACL